MYKKDPGELVGTGVREASEGGEAAEGGRGRARSPGLELSSGNGEGEKTECKGHEEVMMAGLGGPCHVQPKPLPLALRRFPSPAFGTPPMPPPSALPGTFRVKSPRLRPGPISSCPLALASVAHQRLSHVASSPALVFPGPSSLLGKLS